MSPDAALLLLIVATASVIISAQFTCRNTVHCSCSGTGVKFTVCVQQNTTTADPCTQWPGCNRCEDPSCYTAMNRTLRSRQKRQYASYGGRRWHSHSTGPERSARQSTGDGDGDCSEDIRSPKPGSMTCDIGRGRKTCTGTCIPGYTFEGSSEETRMELSCMNGQWTPARSFPRCISGGYCDLEVHGYGSYNCSMGMQGTRCDVFCAARYEGLFTCYPGRPWERLPRCVRPKGGESRNPQRCRCENGDCDINGRCVCPAGRTGTRCETIIAEKKKSCSDPGLVSNGYRRNLNGAESNTRRNFEDGESLLFGCRSNEHALQGSPVMTCRDGKWSEKLPKCIKSNPDPVVTCPDPGQVANANRLNKDGSLSQGVQSYRIGQSVVYTCREGYALHGKSLITCRSSGSWSDLLPHCTLIPTPEAVISTAAPVVTCPDPGQVANANRLNADGSLSRNVQSYRIGQSVVFTCRAGYALHRSSLITCRSSGSWSDTLPHCTLIPTPETVISTASPGRIVYCRDPGLVWNGERLPVNPPSNRGFPQGSSLAYSCDPGYTLKGVGNIFCFDSGSWSHALPRCEEQKPPVGDGEFCLNPVSIVNGKITYYPNRSSQRGSEVRLDDLHYPPNSRLVYSCNAGYQLKGASEMTCKGDNGLWSIDPPPTCVPSNPTRNCKNPGPLNNGRRVLFLSGNNRRGSTENPEYPDGARFQYACDVGYTMNGRRLQTCEKGNWSSSKPTCKIGPVVYCGALEPILHGEVKTFPPAMSPKSGTSISEDNIEYPEGTLLQYTCDDGFVLLGASSLSCGSNMQWSSDPPICSAECGRSSAGSSTKVSGGNESLPGEWPWVVSIRENSAGEITCGGAVLNSRTVVTAAHCVPDTSKSYILYFGKIRKLDKDDDELVIKRMSTKIILHPFYSEQTMDSDIGLIQFSDPIRFTDRIQPICLPDTTSTAMNLRTGRFGYVAGFGVNERGLQPNNLMYIRIPVQSNEVCVDFYKRRGKDLVMSQNMFCAGDLGGDKETCEGDSGSALVFFDQRNEHYVMEGLVSFALNSQCGTFGQFIVFTRVYTYVPWLIEILGQK